MKKLFISLGLSLLVIIISFIFYEIFYDFILKFLFQSSENIYIINRSAVGQFTSHLVTPLILGMPPILYLISDKIVSPKSTIQKIIIPLSILFTGILCLILNCIYIFFVLIDITLPAGLSNEIEINGILSSLNNSLFFGFLLGFIIITLSLYLINKK
tara:strand:+ start:253 stop:723 length:471 start_codon:yes stop_codon:yes gene_type:complete